MQEAAFGNLSFPAFALPALTKQTPARRLASSGAPAPFGEQVALVLVRTALEQMQFGVAVLGAGLRVLFANQAARRESVYQSLCREGGGSTEPAVETIELERALAAGQRGRWSLVHLRHGEEGTTVVVAPLSTADLEEDRPVLLVFGARSPSKALAIQFYAQSRGMTLAEVRVLRALSDGLSPREIAERYRVAMSTIRSQLCNIRSKAGVDNLRDLMRTLGSLPPIAPAACGPA